MMRESSSVRLIWSVGRAPAVGGTGRIAAGLLARGFGFFRPRRELLQTFFAQRQLFGNLHAVGNIRRVGGFCFRHEVGDFGLQLRFDLARVFIGKRAVAAGVGVYLRAV